MHKAIPLLSSTTLLFAGLSAHLALKLRNLDAKSPQATTVVAEPAAVPDARLQPLAVTGKPVEVDAPACNVQRAESDRANADSQARYIAQLRVDLANPAKRAAMLDLGKRVLRTSEPRLAEYLEMKDDEFDAFIALLAEQNMSTVEKRARCSPNCQMSDFRETNDRNDEVRRDFLGAERAARYARYEASRMERMAIDRFRATLPDKLALNDEQSEQLISVLAEEHQKFEREAAARGLETAGFGSGVGMVYWDQNQHTVEERVTAARQYADRLHSRAAAVLTAEQLRRYDEVQDSGLANMESSLPWHDALKAGNSSQAVN